MRVALDASYSVGRTLSGVGVYCSRLIDGITAAAPEWEFLLCYRSNRFFRSLVGGRPAPNAARCLLEEPFNFFLPRRADLFHGLNQRLPRYRFRRSVTTFHDLFVMTGEYSTPEFRKRFMELARDAAARSDCIITVSNHTAAQVESLLGIEPSRIHTVHHGVDPIPEFAPEDLSAFRRRHGLERPFVLHVGAVQARKNIGRLIGAFEALDADVDLVLAGSDGYGARQIYARIAASPARQRIRAAGYLPRPAVERLYRSATVLAFPSLDEGFGLPVLEAMSAGLPVITSNRSALPEVAGDAALLIDPTDEQAIAGALYRAVSDCGLRQELIQKGKERAAQFRWPKTAAATLAVYRTLW
jgi:glycosyltransferase involved in cell wall biosynthesis